MKDYKTNVSSQNADSIASYFTENGYNVETIEGCLMDSYLIEVGENTLKMGKVKVRKYIILVEKCLNEWSSTIEMILTDSEDTYNNYYNNLVFA